MIYLITAGGGLRAAADMSLEIGASAWFAGAEHVYSHASMLNVLGHHPDHAVSLETAIDLAHEAFMRACATGSDDPEGIGHTSALASDTLRRSPRQAYTVFIDRYKVRLKHTVFDSREVGSEARAMQDGQCVDDICEACDGSSLTEKIEEDSMERLLARPYFERFRDHTTRDRRTTVAQLVPVSANPWHEGHAWMCNHPSLFRGTAGIEVAPPHKPQLTSGETLYRAASILNHKTPAFSVLVTKGQQKFIDKMGVSARNELRIGVDAYERMLQDDSIETVINVLRRTGCRLYVYSRIVDGVLRKPELPAEGCDCIRESSGYPVEISSTAIREGRQ